MTTATQSSALPVSFKILPMTLGLAALAAVLVPFLFAVSFSLGFRNGGSPGAAIPVQVASAACLVALPWVWTAVSRKEWAWGLAAAFAAASMVLVKVASSIYPHMDRITDPVKQFLPWMPVTLGIMLTAGCLGIFLRTAWKNRNWKAIGFLSAGYLLVALVALVYASVVLFAE